MQTALSFGKKLIESFKLVNMFETIGGCLAFYMII